MKGNNKDLVKKYALGEDIEGYNIEELEDNPDFMFEVIDYTNDINMYYLCSEKVKKNYNFVKKIIDKFKNKIEFITKVANYYLDNTKKDLECRELNIIMSKLIPNNPLNQYRITSNLEYLAKREEIELSLAKNNNLKKFIGMGFIEIFDLYNSSEIIMNDYAKSLINEIITKNNPDFEKMLHQQFKKKAQIEKIGINNYIMNYINCYDSMLASYISTHLDLIKNIREKIIKILSNWENYNTQNERRRYMNMFDMIHEYLVLSESELSETEILYYVAKKLGIKDKVVKYDCMSVNCDFSTDDFGFDMCDIDIEEDMIKFEVEHSLKEHLVYLNIKKIMINQLFSPNPIDNIYELIKEDKKQKSKSKSKLKILSMKDQNN